MCVGYTVIYILTMFVSYLLLLLFVCSCCCCCCTIHTHIIQERENLEFFDLTLLFVLR